MQGQSPPFYQAKRGSGDSKIEISEFFVVFFCCFVVGFCGPGFIIEVSEFHGISIGGNFCNELLFAGVVAYTFIF